MDRTNLIRVCGLFLLVNIFLHILPRNFTESDDVHRISAEIYAQGRMYMQEEEADRVSPFEKLTSLTRDIRGRYVFTRSPGYGIWLAVLGKIGLSAFSASILSLALLTLILSHASTFTIESAESRDGDTLLIFAVLFLTAPTAMILSHKIYMDDYSSAMLLSAGLIIYLLSENREGLTLPFWSGLLVGISTTFRNTGVFALSVILLWEGIRFFGCRKVSIMRVAVFLTAFCIAVIPLLLYYQHMFGSPCVTGYNQRVLINTGSNSPLIGWGRGFFDLSLIWRNFHEVLPVILLGFPLLMLVPLGACDLSLKKPGPREFFFCWFLVYFIFFLSYSIVPPQQAMVGRKFLPLLVPASFLAAFGLSLLHWKKRLGVVVGVVLFSMAVFSDYSFTYITGCNDKAQAVELEKQKQRFQNFLFGMETIRLLEAGCEDIDRNGEVDAGERRMAEIYREHLKATTKN
ncbi:MAG: hypothetical protein PHQ23_05685 [Candidatus Wallbacteria bacterium]|nr:hypothetical protein [Candidatus Wallbacteria bacterium]